MSIIVLVLAGIVLFTIHQKNSVKVQPIRIKKEPPRDMRR